ncbi:MULTISPECIES: phenylalanine--tRNA ligase subunit beta [unclassified Wenzhouxiangella]|uniref:phenylalanine--tRNA ligase subunit beta n=1 Tax=unclassified Wenzhouxiangella TaxID=2613841 RepID=UPI000E326EDC|nr:MULTISPECIES: phenylalanine--tRNA ligase subunit beta [unclassified Wenzhouxiangella]RFF28000.1 phenylalanine--tRNA ligase subunit beta [Wenzhouxiangella sp. 15181]RFP68587.1 phenylalanine--tRNA ligase subunit beta [Wenzhouxiangella sp. 15190]
MKISHRWLGEWVKSGLSAEEIAERFTLAGLEVDSIEPVAPPLDGVVVGEILSVEPHPDADRLRVCRVAGDSEERIIVCGAPNAREGLKAPLAVMGTTLPGGMKIKPAKLRGVDSQGMLCSEPELGLGEEAGGLMELPGDAPVGESLAAYLGLDDHIIEVDLTPNRADCLSVRGLARELSAITEKPIVSPKIEAVAAVSERGIDIELDSPEDCPCYVGRVIEGIDVTAATPLWMVERLRRSGIRSLGPIVDVTNYVLLELGQPMHAFDLDKIEGGIRVRRAAKGEKITLLDGQAIEPDADMLLIADHDQPLAIAGVMGGQDSAVGDNTRDILLESAWFNPATISGRARRLGLSTESAHRFERGVDPALQRIAAERATRLIVDIAGGRPGPVVEAKDEEHLPDASRVTLRLTRLNRVLGSELDADSVDSILERLGMEVSRSDDHFKVVAPTARRDIEIEADLIEEVARIYGYDRLPTRHPGGEIVVKAPPETRTSERALRQQLAARGFQEVIAWSFVSQAELDALSMGEGAQALANPLSREMAVLRTSLLPGLLNVAGRNLRRQIPSFRLFETGHCFRNGPEVFEESWRLGLLMTGDIRPQHFSGKSRATDYFDLKGEVEHLLAFNAVEGKVRFQRADLSWLHPGQAARLLIDDKPAGWLGQLHPALADELELDQAIYVAEFDGRSITARRLPEHRDSGRFPAVRRDIAFVVSDEHPASNLIDAVRESAGGLLEDCVIFDQYRGEGIEKGFRSLAMGLILRDVSRTLKDREVDALLETVLADLEDRFGAKLRG